MVGMSSPSDAVSTYIFAKDGNRPHLMRRAFTEDAELEIVVKTDAISFPSSAKGSSAIEDIVVRRFGLDYENVYTFCLSQPSQANRRHFPCHWLVGMSARSDGSLPYPWCTPDQALSAAPAIEGFAEIKSYLAKVRPLSAEG